MKEPKISIIMPAYGVEKYIGEAIESVISQSYNNWELIIVDDGSKDDSAVIAKQYATTDDRIQVVSKRNGGLSDARNFGLRFTTGEYIHFFDSDDYIDQNYYFELVSCIKEKNPDIIISGFTTEHRDHNNTQIYKTELIPNKNITATNLLQYIDFAWNKLFKIEFIKKHNLEYERGLYLIEDCEFMSRVLQCNPSTIISFSTGYNYINRPRKTLSKVFDSNTLAFIDRRIYCTKQILTNWGFENEAIEEAIKYEKFSNLKALLNLLYKSTEKKKRKAVKNILNIRNFKKISLKQKELSIKDTVLYYSIKYNMISIISLIYTLKGLQHKEI